MQTNEDLIKRIAENVALRLIRIYANGGGGSFTMPLAADGVRGGVQVGYTTDASARKYAVQLDNEKAYVNVPWTDHTYTLAGLVGGSAIGGSTQPIYWNGSSFVNTSYTLAKSVPSDAVFTDTDTWRPVEDNLTSTSTTNSLSANQGRVLNNKFDSYLPLTGGTMSGSISFNSKDTYNIGSASANLSYLYANSIHPGNNNNLWLYANNNTHIIANGPLIIPISNDVGLSSYGRYALAVGGDPRNNESHIAMDNNEIMAKGSASTSATLYLNAEGGTVCINETAGNCGIGTASPSYKLHVDGTIYASGSITERSDIRCKDVETYQWSPTLDMIADAPIIRYSMKDDKTHRMRVGSVAQYWEKIMPETVSKDNEGILSIAQGDICMVNVIALAREVRKLREEVIQLKKWV